MRSNPAAAYDARNGVYQRNPFDKVFKDLSTVLSKRKAKEDHRTLNKRRAWKYKVQDPISPAPRVSYLQWR